MNKEIMNKHIWIVKWDTIDDYYYTDTFLTRKEARDFIKDTKNDYTIIYVSQPIKYVLDRKEKKYLTNDEATKIIRDIYDKL